MSILPRLTKSFFRYDLPTIVRMFLPAVFVTFLAFTFNDFVMRSVYANTALNIGIVTTATCGFILIFVRLFSLQSDMRGLIRFNKEVSVGKDMKELLSSQWIQKRSIRHYLEPIAHTEGKLSSQLDQNAIKHELEALSDEYESKMELPQFIVGFMIALGLLGTFIGLLTTLTGISSMLDSMGHGQDIEREFSKLVSELRRPLAGMGIAFSSSMFGLIFSLMLAVMMTMLRRFTSRVMEKARTVMNQVTTRVASDPQKKIGEPQDLAPGASARDVSVQMVNSVNILVKRMEGVAKSIDKSLEGTRKTNELLAFGPKLKETSDLMLQELRTFSSHHDDNQKTLRKITNGLIQIEQALVANNPQAMVAAQKETISITSDVFAGVQTLSNIMGSVLEAQREGAGDTSQAIRQANDNLLQEIKSLSEHQAAGQKLFNKVVHSLVQIDQSLLANSPRELLGAQQETIAKLNDMFAAMQSQSRLSSSLLEAQKEGSDETAQILKHIKDHFVRLEDVNVGASNLLDEIKSGISHASSSLSSVEDISDNVGRQTVLLEASQDMNKEELARLFENLQNHISLCLGKEPSFDKSTSDDREGVKLQNEIQSDE